MPPPMQATTTTRHHHARHHRAQQRQYSAMFGIAVLAAALMTMAAVGPCQAKPIDLPTEQPSCLYPLAELTFNPWDAWNILTLGNLGLFSGSLTQGNVFVGSLGIFMSYGGQVNTAPSTFATQPPFAVTAAVYAYMFDSTIINGGVEAQWGVVQIVSSTVHGHVRAVGEELSTLNDAVVDGDFVTKKTPGVSGNTPSVTLVDSVENSINAGDVMMYLMELSSLYANKLQDVARVDLSTVEADGIIRVTLHNRVNIVTDVTADILQKANKIILSGIPNAVVIFNILDTNSDLTVLISKLDVVYEGARGRVAEPTFNQVLLHFPYNPNTATANVYLGAGAFDWGVTAEHLHTQGKEQSTANHTEIVAQARAIHAAHAKRTHARVAAEDLPVEKPVMHFSVLAPGSFFSVDNVIVKGNLIGYNVGLTNGAEVHTQPWGRFAPRGGSVKPQPPRQPGKVGPKPAKVNAKCLWGNI